MVSPICINEASDPKTVLPKLNQITEGFLDCIQDLAGLPLNREQREMLAELEITAYHALLQARDFNDDLERGQ
ncbi:MAG: hypothetical protein AAF959_21125 [Cyanobacteria bacterium P01_D01_bin.56]